MKRKNVVIDLGKSGKKPKINDDRTDTTDESKEIPIVNNSNDDFFLGLNPHETTKIVKESIISYAVELICEGHHKKYITTILKRFFLLKNDTNEEKSELLLSLIVENFLNHDLIDEKLLTERLNTFFNFRFWVIDPINLNQYLEKHHKIRDELAILKDMNNLEKDSLKKI